VVTTEKKNNETGTGGKSCLRSWHHGGIIVFRIGLPLLSTFARRVQGNCISWFYSSPSSHPYSNINRNSHINTSFPISVSCYENRTILIILIAFFDDTPTYGTLLTFSMSLHQCSGSGCTCFWASRIRIRILQTSSKNSRKTLISTVF